MLRTSFGHDVMVVTFINVSLYCGCEVFGNGSMGILHFVTVNSKLGKGLLYLDCKLETPDFVQEQPE